MNWVDRLNSAFEKTGWSKAELARRAGVSYDNVVKYLGGKVEKPRGDSLSSLASALNVDPIWLEHGLSTEYPTKLVPLKGYIGAGQHVEALDDGSSELIEAPADSHANTVAAIIKGDSMLPVFPEGWIIYWSKRLPPSDLVNRLAVVQLTDGRIYVKTIRHGSQPGLWTLTSSNAAEIVDVVIEWAAKVDWVKPSY
ncbi:LexA family transcriptional regulator [Martelella sp. AD-3]|uniref:LexA family transcriptional regulator n=1 Tax=Martelella sp. AD-3 TaxID=686597 RepID=UPI0004676226|nr:LexA family transcriptional regulator [Martelella sp. AD-3]AMM84778.1 hypothetical protein AZF01_10765 [Martelella sp. AD-3]|tara:strand:- start:35 stop:622 length:588 start_codon:yes stop_codon:yes gene_type:complete